MKQRYSGGRHCEVRTNPNAAANITQCFKIASYLAMTDSLETKKASTNVKALYFKDNIRV